MNLKEIIFDQITEKYSDKDIKEIMLKISFNNEPSTGRLKNSKNKKQSFEISSKDFGTMGKVLINKIKKRYIETNPGSNPNFLIVNILTEPKLLSLYFENNGELIPFKF